MNVRTHRQTTSRGRRTRAAILVAALGELSQRGYAGVAMPDIARVANIAPATIYRHFASKEELVNAVFRAAKSTLMEVLLSELTPATSSRERFAAAWRGLTRYAVEHPTGFAFLELHHHAAYLSSENRAFEMRSLELIITMLELGIAAGDIKPIAPAILIIIVWGSWVGLIKATREGHLELTDDVIADAERACWDAVAAHP